MKKIGSICVVIIMLLTACNRSESTKKTVVKEIKKETKMLRPEKAEKIELKLGGSFKELREKYPNIKPKKIVVGKSEPVYYYQKRWSTKQPATIAFNFDEKVLELPNTIYIFIPEDSIFTEKGIKRFKLQTGITQADLMTYEEARVKFYAFLQKLLKQGWKRALSYYDPRISGRHSFHYKLTEDKRYNIDPSYEPTLEEWKNLETGGFTGPNYWLLHYNNNIFLQIKLGVVPHKTDPTLASYLMFITIRDGEEEAMAHFEGENRAKWKKKWTDLLKNEALPNRNEEEIKAKAKGYTIDENYEDYVIDPKEW